jgi:hypothetical protein
MRHRFEYNKDVLKVSEKFKVKKMSYLLLTTEEYPDAENYIDGVKFVGIGTSDVNDIKNFLSFYGDTAELKVEKMDKEENLYFLSPDFKFSRRINGHKESWYAYGISDLNYKKEARSLSLEVCMMLGRRNSKLKSKRKVSFPNFESKLTIKLSNNHRDVLDNIWNIIKDPDSTTQVNRSASIKFLIEKFGSKIS